MKKTGILLICFLLSIPGLLAAGSLDDSFGLTLGLQRHLESSEVFDDGTSLADGYEGNTDFALGMLIYPGRIGIGIDYMFGTYDRFGVTSLEMLMEFNLYYRLYLLQSIGIFGAAGGSMYVSEDLAYGYNLRAGAEFFIGKSTSISVMGIWRTLTAMESYDSYEQQLLELGLTSVLVNINFYMF